MANLIVYYSRKGENYRGGKIVELAKGNTEIVAGYIRGTVGGDLFELEPVNEYPKAYRACVETAVKELREKARPALRAFPPDPANYDTVFIGYPNWCGTMPMPVYTFLEHFGWAGRRIAPFCTNEGSGMGSSERDIAGICAGAEILPGLSVRGAEAEQSEEKIAAWAREIVG